MYVSRNNCFGFCANISDIQIDIYRLFFLLIVFASFSCFCISNIVWANLLPWLTAVSFSEWKMFDIFMFMQSEKKTKIWKKERVVVRVCIGLMHTFCEEMVWLMEKLIINKIGHDLMNVNYVICNDISIHIYWWSVINEVRFSIVSGSVEKSSKAKHFFVLMEAIFG